MTLRASLVAMNHRYRIQRANLDRIIAANEARIAELDAATVAEARRRSTVKVGDVVDVYYLKPNENRQFVNVTVASITRSAIMVRWTDDHGDTQFRTLLRDRIGSIEDVETGEELFLPALPEVVAVMLDGEPVAGLKITNADGPGPTIIQPAIPDESDDYHRGYSDGTFDTKRGYGLPHDPSEPGAPGNDDDRYNTRA